MNRRDVLPCTDPWNPGHRVLDDCVLNDRGSATVVGAAVILGMVALSLVIVHGVTGVVNGHRAVAAADLTALSAAVVMQTSGIDSACRVADSVASDNGAELTECAQVSGDRMPYGTGGELGVMVTVVVAGQSREASAGPGA